MLLDDYPNDNYRACSLDGPLKIATRKSRPFIHYPHTMSNHSTKPAPIQIPTAQVHHTQTLNPLSARTDSQRWSLLSTRSAAPSPTPPFIYGVMSTKIYCRPTCPARLARRANVVFFDTAAQAQEAGFRACKRCRPDVKESVGGKAAAEGTSSASSNAEQNAAKSEASTDAADYVAPGDGEEGRKKVVKAVEIIKQRAEKGEKVSLAELGREVGLSKWHLLRVFRKRWGVSPREMGEGALAQNRLERDGNSESLPQRRVRSTTSADTGGVDVLRDEEADQSEHVSPAAITISATTETETSIGTPSTSELSQWDYAYGDVCWLGPGDPMLTFEESLPNFEAMEVDMNAPLPNLWADGESAEDVLRDLFPEIYQQR